MSDTVRFAVVGLGNMGSVHAQNLLHGKITGATLTAVCDSTPKRRQWAMDTLPNVPVFSSCSEMLSSGLADAVVIATPHYRHPLIAIEAFKAGLHVLTEKPAGVQVSAVKAINDVARQSGKVFGVMFNQRTHPLFQRARQIVQSGELGEKKRLQWTVTNWYRTQAYYDSGSWRATWGGEGGGVLLNQAPHQLDLWQWIFGMPESVWASCTCGRYHHIEVEDDATIFARYANGATATFITTTGEYPGTNRLEIAGDRGKLVLEDGKMRWWRLERPERETCFEPDGDAPAMTFEEILPDGAETAHVGILQNFTDAIRNGTPLLAGGYEAINELILSNAAYLSAWTGEEVHLPLDTARFDALLQERIASSRYDASGEMTHADGNYKSRWNVNW